MKITNMHYQFFIQKKTGVPSWAMGLAPQHKVSVHELINLQSGIQKTVTGMRFLHTQNTLTILRGARARGALRSVLESMRVSDDKRRAAHALKWLARIDHAIACRWVQNPDFLANWRPNMSPADQAYHAKNIVDFSEGTRRRMEAGRKQFNI